MDKLNIAEKSFEDWAELAKNDPLAFEKMRLAAIDNYIESVPEGNRERLRRLQWRIDQERRLAHNPLNACLRLTRMMWDNVLGHGGLRDHFDQLSGLLGGESTQPFRQQRRAEPKTAQVLSFARASD